MRLHNKINCKKKKTQRQKPLKRVYVVLTVINNVKTYSHVYNFFYWSYCVKMSQEHVAINWIAQFKRCMNILTIDQYL